MSTEYIRSINVHQGNVYITSKSSNDDRPYHNWLSESLSEVYQNEGQRGLDREVMGMLCEYAVLTGHHKSIARYRFAQEAKESRTLHQQFIDALNAAYALLTDEEKKQIYTAQTDAVKQYRQTERILRKQKYTALAELCAAYEKQAERNGG